eukprot:GEMP01016573.1.p1 GENE.GEMP01016573.1~~GEMP01016573.1.p1  ORF type:complete len:641 (+),score=101.33 GEMP01016573.1:338-2260(+)
MDRKIDTLLLNDGSETCIAVLNLLRSKRKATYPPNSSISEHGIDMLYDSSSSIAPGATLDSTFAADSKVEQKRSFDSKDSAASRQKNISNLQEENRRLRDALATIWQTLRAVDVCPPIKPIVPVTATILKFDNDDDGPLDQYPTLDDHNAEQQGDRRKPTLRQKVSAIGGSSSRRVSINLNPREGQFRVVSTSTDALAANPVQTPLLARQTSSSKTQGSDEVQVGAHRHSHTTGVTESSWQRSSVLSLNSDGTPQAKPHGSDLRVSKISKHQSGSLVERLQSRHSWHFSADVVNAVRTAARIADDARSAATSSASRSARRLSVKSRASTSLKASQSSNLALMSRKSTRISRVSRVGTEGSNTSEVERNAALSWKINGAFDPQDPSYATQPKRPTDSLGRSRQSVVKFSPAPYISDVSVSPGAMRGRQDNAAAYHSLSSPPSAMRASRLGIHIPMADEPRNPSTLVPPSSTKPRMSTVSRSSICLTTNPYMHMMDATASELQKEANALRERIRTKRLNSDSRELLARQSVSASQSPKARRSNSVAREMLQRESLSASQSPQLRVITDYDPRASDQEDCARNAQSPHSAMKHRHSSSCGLKCVRTSDEPDARLGTLQEEVMQLQQELGDSSLESNSDSDISA